MKEENEKMKKKNIQIKKQNRKIFVAKFLIKLLFNSIRKKIYVARSIFIRSSDSQTFMSLSVIPALIYGRSLQNPYGELAIIP